MQPPPTLRYITARKAADLLNLTPVDIEHIAERGELDSLVDDGRFMVSEQSVNNYLRQAGRA